MRRQLGLRARRHAVAGTLGLATILTAGASAAAQAPGQDAIDVRVVDSTLRAGQSVQVSGRLPAGTANTPVTLAYRPRGGSWTTVRSATTGTEGWFLLSAPVARTGAVRVSTGDSTAARAGDAVGDVVASPPRPVSVAAALRVGRVRLDVLGGASAFVRGALRPRDRGRTVALQVRRRGHWREVARTKTGRGGGYVLRFRPRSSGSWRVRVRFPGDRFNTSAVRPLHQRLSTYASGEASWYGPGFWGGGLACGGHLEPSTMGVANKTLPCGTMVTLHYGSHTVRVPVIDRGPYSGIRIFDLTQATKEALGFPDVGTVWYTT